ncbi:zinc dependent phospholipase C family protein [Pseudodesulfovibrio tunisiensis]|uniref:zinc dependent phospholipase C family protein n=1 Tax=Pseudodesulfovibrio tunisiensis TaxID=463192 RepID=UPI001FB556C6|nr:zinc dependent phospholipase C family protein [Pseudodesulfovibrio tunisiensis]
MKAVFILAVTLVFALAPDLALAWGPGVHLALGNSVLAGAGALPPLVASLLLRNRSAFLYGCLSADIFIGKGCSVHPGHSHNWCTGFKLLRTASTPLVRAYAYGYLSHLAADVVAHNYYVPNALWHMPSGGRISHVYVEAQADRRFETEHERALALFRKSNKVADGSLLTAMDRRKLPFLVKKQIVKGSLKLFSRKTWGSSLDLADRILPWSADSRPLNAMLALSRNVVFDMLSSPENSPAVSFDPIGSRNLRRVRVLRMAGSRAHGGDLFVAPSSLTTLPVARADNPGKIRTIPA